MKNITDVLVAWQAPRWYNEELVIVSIDEIRSNTRRTFSSRAVTLYSEIDDEEYCVSLSQSKIEKAEVGDILIIEKNPLSWVRGARLIIHKIIKNQDEEFVAL